MANNLSKDLESIISESKILLEGALTKAALSAAGLTAFDRASGGKISKAIDKTPKNVAKAISKGAKGLVKGYKAVKSGDAREKINKLKAKYQDLKKNSNKKFFVELSVTFENSEGDQTTKDYKHPVAILAKNSKDAVIKLRAELVAQASGRDMQIIKVEPISIKRFRSGMYSLAYYDNNGKESKIKLEANSEQEAEDKFKDKYTSKGYILIPNSIMLVEGKLVKITEEIKMLCENTISVNEMGLGDPNDFSALPEVTQQEINSQAEDLMASQENFDELMPNYQVDYLDMDAMSNVLDVNDVNMIATESFLNLFESVQLYMKILYKGLGSVKPTYERFVNKDAVNEAKDFFNFSILELINEFSNNESLQVALENEYNIRFNNWNTLIAPVVSAFENVKIGSKVSELYDSLADFREALLLDVTSITSNSDLDTSDIELNLEKFLGHPFINDRVVGLNYLLNLVPYTNRNKVSIQ